MEALVAVGLAGNVVQFASSAGTIIKEANRIRKSGSPSSLPELKKFSEDLLRQATRLRTCLKASSATLAEEDQNLLDLTFDCEEAGTEFIAYLDGLMSSSSSSIRKSTKKAIKFHWASHKIDNFVSTLDRLRNSLNLATVLALRTNNDGNNPEVLKHLIEIRQDHQSQIIGTTRTQDVIGLLSEELRDHTSQVLKILEERSADCLDEIKALHQNMERTEKTIGREEQILRWLDFRQIRWRYNTVQEAYNTTYEWVFQPPEGQNEWDDFAAHLRNDSNDPYFINGKAGSGKSTLMKFVQNHQNTEKLLRQWAGSKHLAISQFYFWNLGTPLQKTHIGLLRGLLHEVLEQYPELIPAVFPKLYRGTARLDDYHPPQYVELKEAFEMMIKKSQFLKLAIFIDGIDEYEGDHRSMAEFLRTLASSKVKLILSSRPLNACLSALEGCPSLQLQDLTRSDMQFYVQRKFSSHSLMVRATQNSLIEASRLQIELVRKADGVFLWVILSVRILIEGFDNGDSLDELQTLLKSLPSDLEDLYRRMFAKMDPRYRRQGSELFQLVHEHQKVFGNEHFLTRTLIHTFQPSSNALELPILPITPSLSKENIRDAERRVRSRSCGLLEIRFDKLAPDTMDASYIGYLHRTVGEFFALDEIWAEILGATEGTNFDPAIRLASAFLAVAKTFALENHEIGYIFHCVSRFCRSSSALTHQMTYEYVVELDKMMHIFDMHTESSVHMTIHAAAARSGLVNYFQSTPFLDCLARSDKDHPIRYKIVIQALDTWQPNAKNLFTLSTEERSDLLSHLLTNVLGPEDGSHGYSLWNRALETCPYYARAVNNPRHAMTAASLLRTFLKASKNPRALWQRACNDKELTGFDPTPFLEIWGSEWECRFMEPLMSPDETELLNRILDEIRTLIGSNGGPSYPRNSTGSNKKRRKSGKRKSKGKEPQNKGRR